MVQMSKFNTSCFFLSQMLVLPPYQKKGHGGKKLFVHPYAIYPFILLI